MKFLPNRVRISCQDRSKQSLPPLWGKFPRRRKELAWFLHQLSSSGPPASSVEVGPTGSIWQQVSIQLEEKDWFSLPAAIFSFYTNYFGALRYLSFWGQRMQGVLLPWAGPCRKPPMTPRHQRLPSLPSCVWEQRWGARHSRLRADVSL